MIRKRSLPRLLMPLAIMALPMVLLITSLRTLQELDEQRTVYLRNRAAMVSGRLENLPAGVTGDSAFEILAANDPSLVDLRLIKPGSADDHPSLDVLWNGLELFRTESLHDRGTPIFRAYVPFHSGQTLRIARIDLDAAAADFLVVHARHNVLAASLGGLVLILLSIYSIWATRRASNFKVRQLELEHLAHIGKMSAVLAHEIRNPLGTIKGFAQLAGESADGRVRDLLAPILDETRRLENLVNDLLLYGRPPAPVVRPAEWLSIAASLEANVRQLIGDRPIRLAIAIEALRWETDPHLLQQALLNVLRNAVEAIAEDTAAEVTLRIQHGRPRGLTISVTDTGPGIPDAAKARLFEPFFTTKAFGTGLGLSITRKLVEALEGSLELRTAPGRTEAVLHFPGARVEEMQPTFNVPQ